MSPWVKRSPDGEVVDYRAAKEDYLRTFSFREELTSKIRRDIGHVKEPLEKKSGIVALRKDS
jgi:hypothetical protein